MRTGRKQRDTALEKQQLREAIECGEISMGEAVRRMRRISGYRQEADDRNLFLAYFELKQRSEKEVE